MYGLIYGLVSCLMIIMNKLAATSINPTSILLLLQTFVTTHIAGCVLVFQKQTLRLADVKACFFYVTIFLSGMYFNIKSLVYNEIEVVLIMRGICPLIIFPFELAMKKIQMLDRRSTTALVCMISSIFVYAYIRISTVSPIGLFWGLCYIVCTCFSLIIQNIIVNDDDKNPMVMTFYTNQISTLFMSAMFCVEAVLQVPVYIKKLSPVETVALSMSCVLGACISYLGWKCQQIYSAMHMSMINASSKILTLAINRAISNEQTPPVAAVAVVVYFISVGFFRTEKVRRDEQEHLIS